jgi:ribose 5-phosphate isomerase B
MKVALGSDHRGVDLKKATKKFLEEQNIDFEDFGTSSKKAVDYPDIGLRVAQEVASKNFDIGILFCATGIGMSITANKVKGVYAALCLDEDMASYARKHNNANVCAIGAKYTDTEKLTAIIKTFLKTKFESGRHKRRFNKVVQQEAKIVSQKDIESLQKTVKKLEKEVNHWRSRAWRR